MFMTALCNPSTMQHLPPSLRAMSVNQIMGAATQPTKQQLAQISSTHSRAPRHELQASSSPSSQALQEQDIPFDQPNQFPLPSSVVAHHVWPHLSPSTRAQLRASCLEMRDMADTLLEGRLKCTVVLPPNDNMGGSSSGSSGSSHGSRLSAPLARMDSSSTLASRSSSLASSGSPCSRAPSSSQVSDVSLTDTLSSDQLSEASSDHSEWQDEFGSSADQGTNQLELSGAEQQARQTCRMLARCVRVSGLHLRLVGDASDPRMARTLLAALEAAAGRLTSLTLTWPAGVPVSQELMLQIAAQCPRLKQLAITPTPQ